MLRLLRPFGIITCHQERLPVEAVEAVEAYRNHHTWRVRCIAIRRVGWAHGTRRGDGQPCVLRAPMRKMLCYVMLSHAMDGTNRSARVLRHRTYRSGWMEQALEHVFTATPNPVSESVTGCA